RSLRGSLAHHSQSMEGKNDLSLLLSTEACSSEISSQSKSLMLWRVGSPYIYCSRVSEETEVEVKHEWKIAGSCKRLRYDMQEDPANLAQTADRLIEDEVRHIRQLVNN